MDNATVSDKLVNAGQTLLGSGSNIGAVLNQAIKDFLPFFQVTRGLVVDQQGQKTEIFDTIICTETSKTSDTKSIEISADATACIVDVSEAIGIDSFRAAFNRIVCAKKLKKITASHAGGRLTSTATMGIIFSIKASVPLEVLAEELEELNRKVPSSYWPDMIVILSQGIINYCAQFPGETNIFSDFLLPEEGISSPAPAIYVIPVMKPAGKYTFNKMCALLIGHLNRLSPGADLPNLLEILKDTNNLVVTLAGYQYNLHGNLLPVPREFYVNHYLPQPPLQIEDKRRKFSGALQFLPWQDGGVIFVDGTFPIAEVLSYLDKRMPQNNSIKRNNIQSSCVLPITQVDFHKMVGKIEEQSGFIIRRKSTSKVMQKIADEGSSSPFVARLLIGILTLKDAIFMEKLKKDEFDKKYHSVSMELWELRNSVKEIVKIFNEHSQKVSQGSVAQIIGKDIKISESIDRELKKKVGGFLYDAARILKCDIQRIVEMLNKNIGFLYGKPAPFLKGVALLEASDPALAQYLRETRQWSERLINLRNDLDHKSWQLPKIKYSNNSGVISADEPQIAGVPLIEFVNFMLDRLSCATEEIVAHCLQSKMPEGLSLSEIPILERRPEMPLRFRVILSTGGMSLWSISYHQSLFEET